MTGHRLPLVYAGVPVRGRSNPYLVLLSRESLVDVEASVEALDEGPSRVSIEGPGLGWRFEIAVKSFVDVVADRLEQPLHVGLRVGTGLGYPPAASIYAVATLEILRVVAEEAGYTLEGEELLRSASSIDQDAGAWYDYVDAMRAALVEGSSLVYRSGEQPIPLGLGEPLELELVGEEDLGEELAVDELGEEVASPLVRLAGMLVVSLVSGLREGSGLGREEARKLARIENGLYYILYGVEPPEDDGCKWVPSLQRVYGVCLPGKRLGDTVAFTL